MLRTRSPRLAVTFDPRQVTALDGGTVRKPLTWQPEDGSSLDAPSGAMVTDDWSELRARAAVKTPYGA